MPVTIHPQCKARLVDVLTEAVSALKVENGKTLDRRSAISHLFRADGALPTTGRLRSELARYIDEYPVTDFAMDLLSMELDERFEWDSNRPVQPLIELAGFREPEAVAHLLLTRLESLPWHYTLSFRLPKNALPLQPEEEMELSPAVRLVRPHNNFELRYPLKSSDAGRQKRLSLPFNMLIGGGDELKWDSESVYLQIDVEGFIGPYGGSFPEVEARRSLRAFCGLGIALRLFQVEHSFRFVPLRERYFVHRQEGLGRELDNTLELPDDDASVLYDLKLNTLDGKLTTEQHQRAWSDARLAEMRTVFSAGQRGEQLRLASQWLFDSYRGRDQLLQFIQAITVVEILLGNKDISDEIGLGELLRNRCAYLIGESHKERDEILKEFNEIYRVRSQIVHSGKHRLTFHEYTLFEQLRWMCRRIIHEEVKLLQADKQS